MALFRMRNIGSHHIIGAGTIATLLGVYHYASDNGLLGLVGYQRLPTVAQVEKTIGALAQNTTANYGTSYDSVPPGVPTSYNNTPANSYASPQQSYQTQNYAPQGYTHQGYSPQTYPPPQQQNTYGASGNIRVLFSPAGGCTDAIVNEIGQAQRQILIQAYSFTSEPIAAACVAAHQRGVGVYAILDRSQEAEKYSAADFLANSGIPTLIDSKHQIAHNKIILIDGRTIITGSFNFTSSAEKSNAENLLIIHDRPDLYSQYEENLKHHYEHSAPYTGRGNGQPAHSHNR